MNNTLVRHYSIKTPKVESPGNEWVQRWHGLYELKESQCDISNDEYNLETDVFLSMVESISSKEIVFMEIGAGSASWCLALNAVVMNKLVNTRAKGIKCYAIEADLIHIDWIEHHFKAWDIDSEVIPYAVSGKNGYCKFTIGEPDWYGQSIVTGNGIARTLYRSIVLSSNRVKCFTLDTIVKDYNIEKIDFAHMDIQGAEYDAIKGAKGIISAGIVDYWMIGTHNSKYNKLISQEMTGYELLVDLYPNSVAQLNGSSYKMQDGMQVYKRIE